MNRIYNIKVVHNFNAEEFESDLWNAVHMFQNDGLEVELQYDSESSYTCLVIARLPLR